VTVPALFFGLLIATACGLLFHLVRGGSLSRLALYIGAAWVAFTIGHYAGEWLSWSGARLGPINVLPALLATAVGLVVASFLAGPEREQGKGGSG
jgi:hypothetical protein